MTQTNNTELSIEKLFDLVDLLNFKERKDLIENLQEIHRIIKHEENKQCRDAIEKQKIIEKKKKIQNKIKIAQIAKDRLNNRIKKNVSIMKAINAGSNKFEGDPCPNCGQNVRYVVTRACVACATKSMKKAYNKRMANTVKPVRHTKIKACREAAAEGKKKFIYKCNTCNELTEHYVCDQMCVPCKKIKGKLNYEKNCNRTDTKQDTWQD